MGNKVRKYYPSRWCTLAACLMFLSITGLQYAFGLISETLKDRLNLKQTQVDTIGVLGTIGANSGLIAGLFNNRFGPNISIWFGVVITCIGYSLLAAITTQFFAIKSFIFACFANFLFNHGTAWFSMIATPLIAQNFPVKDHGKLLGLGKGYLGIGSAFISVFKSDLANNNVDMFMLYTMIFIPIVCLIFGWFIILLPNNLSKHYLPNEIKYGKNKKCGLSMLLWYAFAFTFALYLVSIAIIQTVYSFNIYIRYTLFIITCILWISPWFLALYCHGNIKIDYENTCEQIKSLTINTDYHSNNKAIDDTINVGMPQIFGYWQLYLLYMINGIVAGTAVSYISNISQIIESASSTVVYDNENNGISTSLVAITSFGSFCGRVCGGVLVDFFSDKFHCSFWLIIAPFIMTITQIVLFFAGTNILIIVCGGFFIGVSVGWIFSLCIVNVTNLWGTKYLSGNYSLFDSAAAFGGTIFSTFVFGTIYDYYAKQERNTIHYYKGTKCYGQNCYKWTFLICACAAFFALILSIILWKFTSKSKQNIDKGNEE
eukprot:490687_1